MKTAFSIKIALLLLLAVGFTSCNDNFDEDEATPTYPSALSYGAWEPEYDDGSNGYGYAVNFTATESGDTVCNITMTDPESGDVYVYSNGAVDYNPATGLATVSFASSPYNYPAIAYFALQRDLQHATVQVFVIKNGGLNFMALLRAVQAESPVIGGYWENAEAGIAMMLNGDSTCIVQSGYDEYQGTYTFKNGQGSITAGDFNATIRSNEKSQLVMIANGTEHVMSR